jgi:hypothetical protein
MTRRSGHQTMSNRVSLPQEDAQNQAAPSTTLVYPPQTNLRTVGYIESDIPPHIMLKSPEAMQMAAQNMIPSSSIPPNTYQMQQQSAYPTHQSGTMPSLSVPPNAYQMQQPAYPTHQSITIPPSSFPSSAYQMQQPTYPTQQPVTIPSSIYGYTQY